VQRITITLTDKAYALLEGRVAAAQKRDERASRSSLIEETLWLRWDESGAELTGGPIGGRIRRTPAERAAFEDSLVAVFPADGSMPHMEHDDSAVTSESLEQQGRRFLEKQPLEPLHPDEFGGSDEGSHLTSKRVEDPWEE
jgi:hypothetical protein